MTLRLRDGRAIGVLEVGRGPVVFHFHGHGSSRLEVRLVEAVAERIGVRVIALDRPGIGASDPKAGFRILDWPADVVDVADQLGVARFAVEGVSGGACYALACAYALPERLVACGLVSSVAPPDIVGRAGPDWLRASFWTERHAPGLIRLVARLVGGGAGADEENLDRWLLRYSTRLGAGDRALLAVPATRRTLVRALAESSRQGGRANLEEALVGVRPWGFRAEDVAFPNIHLWHGEEDALMPVEPARLLARTLPHCAATFYASDGHFSTFVNHAEDILRALV